MVSRLDRQRRRNGRFQAWDYNRLRRSFRGRSGYPPVPDAPDTPIAVTGVTAGTPGSFTPAEATIPADLAELQGLGALGQTDPWTEGQYVVLGDESEAHWDGDSWESGQAPE